MGVTILIVVLIGFDRYPAIITQEFSSPQACEVARQVVRETTKLSVDVLRCVPK